MSDPLSARQTTLTLEDIINELPSTETRYSGNAQYPCIDVSNPIHQLAVHVQNQKTASDKEIDLFKNELYQMQKRQDELMEEISKMKSIMAATIMNFPESEAEVVEKI